MHFRMLSRKTKLLTLSAAYTELVYVTVSHKLVAAAHYAGVGIFHTQIVVPKIGVGIKLYNVKVVVFFVYRPDRSQSDKMLAPKHKGTLAVRKNFGGSVLYLSQSHIGRTHWKLGIPRVKYFAVKHVFVLIGGIGLDTVAFRAYRSAAEARSGTVGRGAVKGCAENNGFRFGVFAVAGYKCVSFYLHNNVSFRYLVSGSNFCRDRFFSAR